MNLLLQPWHTTIAGQPAGCERPVLLAVSAALCVATAWLVRRTLQRKLARGWVAPRLADRLVPGRAPAREALKVALMGAALALLALACAGPFWGELKHTMHRRGVDVVVALDASRSMLAQDVSPDRLIQARIAVESLIDQLHGDRIGLVTFAKDAFVQAPLTTDYAAARLYLRAVDPMQMQQGGTDVGGALSAAKGLLERGAHGDRQRVVVLLTDGEDWGSRASDAAKALGDAGVKLFTVAVGSEAGAPVPALDDRGREVGVLRDAEGAPIVTRANRPALAALAQVARGESFDLAGDVKVAPLAQAIDHLQKGDIEVVSVSATAQRFAWFALPSFALMLAALWLSPARRRRLAPAAAMLALLAIPPYASADVLHRPQPDAEAGARAYAAGHFDEALKHFDADRAHPDDARFNRGDALAGMGKRDEAIDAFKTNSPSLRGRDAYNRGTLQAPQHPDEAISSLRQALIADPSNEDARHNLEVLLAQKYQQQKDNQSNSGGPEKQDQPKSGSDDKQNQAKSANSAKHSQPNPGDGDMQHQPRPGDGAPSAQPKPGGGEPQPRSEGGPSASGEERAPTEAERALDSIKASDRLAPAQPIHPERSTPDAHPW